MAEITATEAARRFSDLLDAVEQDRESFTIVRHGKVVAQIEPVKQGQGAATKELLRNHSFDPSWADELAEMRELIRLEQRT